MDRRSGKGPFQAGAFLLGVSLSGAVFLSPARDTFGGHPMAVAFRPPGGYRFVPARLQSDRVRNIVVVVELCEGRQPRRGRSSTAGNRSGDSENADAQRVTADSFSICDVADRPFAFADLFSEAVAGINAAERGGSRCE